MQDGRRRGHMAAVCAGGGGGLAAAGQEDDAQTSGGQFVQVRRDPVRQRQRRPLPGGSTEHAQKGRMIDVQSLGF